MVAMIKKKDGDAPSIYTIPLKQRMYVDHLNTVLSLKHFTVPQSYTTELEGTLDPAQYSELPVSIVCGSAIPQILVF